MPRWEPDAADRLRGVALDLFLERGYDAVSVEEIAERAGLTRRTFSRHYADKRDVLFAGSERLPELVRRSVAATDPGLAPFAAAVEGLAEVGSVLAGLAHRSADRRTVIAGSPELRERERTKAAAVAEALAVALADRGCEEARAALLGELGAVVLHTALDAWTADPAAMSPAARVRRTAVDLVDAVAPGLTPGVPAAPARPGPR